MKKILLLLMITIIASTELQAQESPCRSKHDNGQCKEKYGVDSEGDYHGKYVAYDKDGKITTSGNYSHGYKQGNWYIKLNKYDAAYYHGLGYPLTHDHYIWYEKGKSIARATTGPISSLAKANAINKADEEAEKKFIAQQKAEDEAEKKRLEVISGKAKTEAKSQTEERNRLLRKVLESGQLTALDNTAEITSNKIIAQYFQAIGGSNLANVFDITITSKANIEGLSLEVILLQKGADKYQNVMTHNYSLIQRTTINGDQGKTESQNPIDNKVMTAEEISTFKLGSDLFAQLYYDKLSITTKIKGLENVDGTDAYVVEATQLNGHKTILYFDKISGLLLKDIRSLQSTNGTILQTRNYSNYREVNGIKVPHTVESSVGAQIMKTEVQSIEINKGISDDIFKI